MGHGVPTGHIRTLRGTLIGHSEEAHTTIDVQSDRTEVAVPLVARLGGIVVIAGAVCCPLSAASLETEPRGAELAIAIRVYNFARVSCSTLSRAERKATEFFRRASIETEWVDCPLNAAELSRYPRCEALSGPAVITLKILPRSMAQSYCRFSNGLGFALLSEKGRFTTDAFIFFQQVTESAEKTGCPVCTLLALAMAHEIGHLLLGTAGHSSDGIMRTNWGLTDVRRVEVAQLKFSNSEARAIQFQVLQRMALSEFSRELKREPYSELPVP